MRYYEFITEDFKTSKVAFVKQGAEPEEVDRIIADYRALSRKNQFQGDEKNIDWWAKQGWDKFKQRVLILAQTPTKTALKRSKIQGNAIQLQSPDDRWEIFVPLDKEASCNIGTGTDWCTTKRAHNYFENYFYDRGVILVYLVGPSKYAMAMHKDLKEIEFFDKKDASIQQSTFESRTGIKVNDIKEQVMKHIDQITAEQKSANIKDPERAVKYAIQNEKLFPEGEKAIASNAKTAIKYASHFSIRFERAEPVIARDAEASYNYAALILKHRWPEGEDAIAQRPDIAIQYARNIIKGPWPEAEPMLVQNPMYALKYAVIVLKGRFPAYEPIALQKAATAWEYIKHVIKGPWPEAEPILRTSSQYAGYYAQLTGKKL